MLNDAERAMIDTSRLEGILEDVYEPANRDRHARAVAALPAELADVRRQVCRFPGSRMTAVPVAGSRRRGEQLGFFQTQLWDGSVGYLQRDLVDCLQVALACCAQVPPHEVPDFRVGEQLRAGVEPQEIRERMDVLLARWADACGLTVAVRPVPPTTGRWIGVITSDGVFSDHCLIMSGRSLLWDPSWITPPDGGGPGDLYDPADINYGITIERR